MHTSFKKLTLILLSALFVACCNHPEVTSNLSIFGIATADSYSSEFNLPFIVADGEYDDYGWESELEGSSNTEDGLFRNPEGLNAWLQLKFPNPIRVTSATLFWDPKTSDNNVYYLECSKDGESWNEVPRAKYTREKTIVQGLETLKDVISFNPVKATLFRIRIEAGNDSTSFGRIREFELMGNLNQFDTLLSVRHILDGETSPQEILKLVNNPSDAWHLDLPKPMGGNIADGVYFSGPGLENDIDGNLEHCSQMQIIQGCTEEDFHQYIDKLVTAGFRPLEKRSLDKNKYVQLHGNDKVVYAYYTDSEKYIRVICEKSSVTQESFSYPADTIGNVGIYQFALNYSFYTHVTTNCGMLYALLPGDGSVMIMDACHILQTSEEFYCGLYDFLREITRTPEGEKIRISNWFITHCHADHLSGASGFLRRYHDKVDLQRVMFNFPAFSVRPGSTPYTSQFRRILRTYFPDVVYLKPHTGMHIDLASLGIDVMYTHEDAIKADNPTVYPLNDFNCTSTVLKVNMGGCKAVLFGDISWEAEDIITSNYTKSSWETDLVQIAHHSFNYLTTLYEWCHAPVVLVPNNVENTHDEINYPRLQEALKYATGGAYYEGENTYGFCPTDNGFALCYEKPLVGLPVYDGTGN